MPSANSIAHINSVLALYHTPRFEPDPHLTEGSFSAGVEESFSQVLSVFLTYHVSEDPVMAKIIIVTITTARVNAH